MNTAERNRCFLFACLVEGCLLLAGTALVLLFRVPVLGLLPWRFAWILIGLLGTLPLLGVLVWLMNSSWVPVVTVRDFLDEVVRPLLGQFTIPQFLLLAGLAGLAEEFFFRAFLQSWLSGLFGPVAGLILASMAFGACHLVTRFYGLFATVLGVYLGGLMLFWDSFWPPAIAHALYDFLALIWLFKIRKRYAAPHSGPSTPDSP